MLYRLQYLHRTNHPLGESKNRTHFAHTKRGLPPPLKDVASSYSRVRKKQTALHGTPQGIRPRDKITVQYVLQYSVQRVSCMEYSTDSVRTVLYVLYRTLLFYIMLYFN